MALACASGRPIPAKCIKTGDSVWGQVAAGYATRTGMAG